MGGWMRRFKVMAQASRAWDQGCRRQVKILSGDNARVTQHVGSELGIAINGALIGTEIENRQGTIGAANHAHGRESPRADRPIAGKRPQSWWVS